MEKPDLARAEEYLRSGEFVWNSGMFIWKLSSIWKNLEKYMPETCSRLKTIAAAIGTPEEETVLEREFAAMPSVSIDYGIMEKADNVYMLCVDFGWADLGTWGSLFDLAKKDEQNNALLKSEAIMYESNSNIVTLDNPKRLAVIQGINDCIVSESGNVILICKKEDEQRIKQGVADAQMKYGKEFN